MRELIVPVVCKNNKRLVWSEQEYKDVFFEFKSEIRKIYNSIPNIQVEFNKVLSDVLLSNYTTEHYVVSVNNVLKIAFVNINKIPMYHSIETIGKSILKDEHNN